MFWDLRALLGWPQKCSCGQYRMLHARESFAGERKLWRVWMWTDQRAFKTLPTNCRCFCGHAVGGTEKGAPSPPCRHQAWIGLDQQEELMM